MPSASAIVVCGFKVLSEEVEGLVAFLFVVDTHDELCDAEPFVGVCIDGMFFQVLVELGDQACLGTLDEEFGVVS